MNIILVGPPGAGKGTASQLMKKAYNLPYLSTGDVFRSEIQKGTELGKLAKELIDKGNFIPDDITVEIVKNAIAEMQGGYLLDGFPRNMNQVHAFEEMLERSNMKIDLVLHLHIEDEFIVDRLKDRQVCPTCQATYHRIDVPSKVEDVCDACGGNLVTREDDKPEFIQHRLNIYHETTEPIVAYYREKGLLKTIDSNCSVEEMDERIIVVMKEMMI